MRNSYRVFLAAAALTIVSAAAIPASAGNDWHHNRDHGHRGGIGPGAAVALGLGSLALGAALVSPYPYRWAYPAYAAPIGSPLLPPPYYAPPWRPCWSGWRWVAC